MKKKDVKVGDLMLATYYSAKYIFKVEEIVGYRKNGALHLTGKCLWNSKGKPNRDVSTSWFMYTDIKKVTRDEARLEML